MLWGAAGGDRIMNDIECDVCDGEGYVPCEECNGVIEVVKPPTSLDELRETRRVRDRRRARKANPFAPRQS